MTLPAKVCMPVINGSRLLQRDRLFDLLDDPRDASCSWVCGPPGAGKTVLVQSWLQARERRTLWYRVDRSDSDPAVLPHFLRLAAGQIASGLLQRLPALTPDRRGSIGTFACDFFSPLFEAMGSTIGGNTKRLRTSRHRPVLVFDNVDDAIQSKTFAELLAAAVECAELGAVRVVIVGRTEPRGPFARLHAHENLTLIDSRQLRLTEHETQALVALRRVGRTPWSAVEVARLHDWCEGWIGGLVMASADRGDAPSAELQTLTHDRVFPYLAATVLDRQPAAIRDLLMMAALLPTFSAEMAEALCGNPGAATILWRMAERNLFTSVHSPAAAPALHDLHQPPRRPQPPPVYEFHALLRDLLLARGRTSWSAATRRTLLLRVAALLIADGQIDAAVQALVEARAWDAMGDLVRAEAAALVESGRQQTLAGWLQQMPAHSLATDPWLAYWDGQCKLLVDPAAGRAVLALALPGFEANGDAEGRILAWCSIIETITTEWCDFSELDHWIDQGDRLLREWPFEAMPAPLASRLAGAMFGALMWRQPDRPDMGLWHKRACAAVHAVTADGPRILAGTPLFHYTAVQWGNHRELDALYARLRPSVDLAHLSPIEALLASALDAAHAMVRGLPVQAVEHVQRSRQLRDRYNIRLLGSMLFCHEIYALATAGRIDEAAAALARARATELDASRRLEVAHADFQAALIQLQAGQPREALESIHAANRAVAMVGGPHQWSHGALAEAQILHALGDTVGAKCCLVEGLRHQQGARCDILEYEALACQALFEIGTGGEVEPLRAAFAIGARNDILNYIWFRPAMMAKLCARALELGIETDYTLRLIERRGLVPPHALESWPWPVKVYATAGALQVLVHGHALEAHRSKPDAPLRLLHGLVELASRVEPRRINGHALLCRPVERALLGSHLRPHADARSTEDWIDQNLKRLRLQLGHGDAVLGWGGKLALNPLRVWVDVFAGGGKGADR